MYCGIDLGSSSLKCLIIDESGRLLGSGKAAVGTQLFGQQSVSDTAQWRLALRLAFAQAVATVRQGSQAIQAVAISGNGPTLVCLDRHDKALGPALLWTDRSAGAEAATVNQMATGLGLGQPSVDASFYLPKALHVLRQAGVSGNPAPARFFSAPEYLAFCLGADPVSYLPHPYYDRFIWFQPLHNKLGLADSLFPPYVAGGQRIGRVSSTGQAEFGIQAGTPVVSAWPDFLSGLVGSGTIQPGLACDRSGSSEAINLCTDRSLADSGLFCLPHVVPGLWNASGGVSASGRSLVWVQQILGFTSVDQLLAAAQAAAPACTGLVFLPYLDGERAPLWNKNLRPLWQGLQETHTRNDLARAAVEGIVFGLKLSLELMASQGVRPHELRLSGAAAKNHFVSQLKADIFGHELTQLAIAETECVGAACACQLALGQAGSLAEAAENLVHVESRLAPAPASQRQAYSPAWQKFQQTLATALATASEQPALGDQE